MFKKLLFSLFTVVVVGAAGIGASRALLSSNPVTLSANTFSTGSVNLQISLNGTDWSNTSVQGFSGTLNPGSLQSFFLWFKNNTDDSGLKLADQVPVATVSGGVTADDVSLIFTPVDGTGSPSGAASVSHSLQTLSNPQSFPSADILPGNGQQRYRMDVKMGSSVSTQGSVTFDVIFTGTEVTPTPTP